MAVKFRFTPPKHRRIHIAKTANEHPVLTTLNSFLTAEEPQVVQWYMRFWDLQGRAITYRDLREAVLSGGVSPAQIAQWQKNYSVFINQKLAPEWQKAMTEGAKAHVSEKIYRPLVPAMEAYINRHSAELVTAVADEQIKAIRALVLRAATPNDAFTPDRLARLIRPTVGLTVPQTIANMNYYNTVWQAAAEAGLSSAKCDERAQRLSATYAEKQHRYRAMCIARTELAYAYNYGGLAATKDAQERGLMGECRKVWLTAADEAVCDICGALHETSVGMDEDFIGKVNGKVAGLYMVPPAHPNCKCAVAYEEIGEPIKPVEVPTTEMTPLTTEMTPPQAPPALMLPNSSAAPTIHTPPIMTPPITPAAIHTPPIVLGTDKNNLQNTTPNAIINMGGLESALGQKHSDAMQRILQQAPANIQTVWNKYANRLKVIDAHYKQGLALTRYTDGVMFDIDALAQDEMSAMFGDVARKAYYVAFHEFGHNIAALMAQDMSKRTDDDISVYYQSKLFTRTVPLQRADGSIILETLLNPFTINQGYTLDEKLKEEGRIYVDLIMDRLGCSQHDAYVVIKNEMKAQPSIAIVDVSDIWDGLSNGLARAEYGHMKYDPDYWKKISVGMEGFAEMYSATLMNPDSVTQFKYFFPDSYQIFEEILKEMGM